MSSPAKHGARLGKHFGRQTRLSAGAFPTRYVRIPEIRFYGVLR